MKKLLILTSFIGLVMFICGNFSAGSENDLLESYYNDQVSYPNAIAFIGIITVTASALFWCTFIIFLGFKQRIKAVAENKSNHFPLWLFVLGIVFIPMITSSLSAMLYWLIPRIDYTFKCLNTARHFFSHSIFALAESNVFWLALGLTEIILFSIFLFGHKKYIQTKKKVVE